jgi:hypothetical protein
MEATPDLPGCFLLVQYCTVQYCIIVDKLMGVLSPGQLQIQISTEIPQHTQSLFFE